MIKCVCIDADNRPKEIAPEKWIVEKEWYHITHVYIMKNPDQYGIQGVDIYEKPLDDSCRPYETFKMSRFALREQDLQAFIELAKACSQLDEVDVMEILKESEVNVV